MDVMCNKVSLSDHPRKSGLDKIKRMLKNRAAETKPKPVSLKNSTSTSDKSKLNSKPKSGAKKRKSDQVTLNCPKAAKKFKVDHCHGVLLKLMNHKWSCPFQKPMNDKAVKDPMDFGTIKRKLQENRYSADEQFESDVRLIFRNATVHHPSNTLVHLYAVKLNRLFDLLWLSVKPRPATNQPPAVVHENSKVNVSEVVEPAYSPGKALRVAILRAKKKGNNEFGTEAELKATQREKARAYLEQMERSVVVEDNQRVTRDLEALMGCSMKTTKGTLERLGLYLKPEYRLGYEHEDYLLVNEAELEEGEILD